VGKCIGHDITLGLPLQAIVSDGRSALQRRFDITWLDELPLCLGALRPNAGKAIGLQLHPDLQRIRLSLVHSTLRFLHLCQYSKLVLNVVTDLVGNHIRLRKLAGLASDIASPEAPLEVLKEACVEVDFPVDRTIKRTHGGLRKPASRLGSASDESAYDAKRNIEPKALALMIYDLGSDEAGD
jgi:hypothetical protein